MFIERKGIDDPVGAIAVHGIGGTFGVLCVGIFANGTYGAGWNGVDERQPIKVEGVIEGECRPVRSRRSALVVHLDRDLRLRLTASSRSRTSSRRAASAPTKPMRSTASTFRDGCARAMSTVPRSRRRSSSWSTDRTVVPAVVGGPLGHRQFVTNLQDD